MPTKIATVVQMAACRVPTVISSRQEAGDLLAGEGRAIKKAGNPLRTEKAASRGSEAAPTAIGATRRNKFMNSIANVDSVVQGDSQK